MSEASGVASIHPTGDLPVQAIQVKEDDDEAFRLALFGSSSDQKAGTSLAERAQGSVVVIASESFPGEWRARRRPPSPTMWTPAMAGRAVDRHHRVGLYGAGQ